MAKATKNSYKPAKRIGNYKPVKMAEGGNVSELGYSERREYIEENYAPFITDAQMIFSIWDSGIEYDYKADRKEVVNKIIEEYKNLGDYTEATLPQETIYEIQDWDLVRREIDPETDEVIGETPLKEVSADNTYNFSYKGLVDLNWRVYHDEDYDRFFYVITPHLGGDIRGNYGDAIILEGNDRDDLFYRFYEGFISGGASIYFKFKDGSEIGFDSEQDSDVFYFRVNEGFDITGMAQKYLNDFEKFESWQGDEFLEETIDIYLARKGVAPKMMAGGSLNDETPKAYIQILGYDEGKWITITDYSDGQDVIDAIYDWMTELNEQFGGNREEYEVADYEGFGDDLYDQYMSSNEFDEIIEAYEKYEGSDFPADVISAYKKDSGSGNDSLSDVIDEMDNNYFGKYDNLTDFGYEMVSQGVYTPSEYDVYITDTDKRIIAGEEADALVDDMSFDDLLNVAVEVKSEYEDEKSELEDKITEIEQEIEDLTELQKSSDDDDEYETISESIEEKEIELDETQNELDEIDSRYEDKAREEAKELYYDEIHDRLENDLEGWLSDYGYNTDNLADISFVSVDYQKIGEEISSDYLVIEFEGDLYFFNNYAKGGRITASKRKPKYAYYIVENSTKKLVSGYPSKAEAIEQRKLLIQQYPSMRFEIYPLANLEAKTDLDVYAKKDYVELSTLDKIKKVSVDAYRYGKDKVGQAQLFLEKNDVKGKIKRGARSVWDKTKQGGNWLQKQWREADFGDGKGKAKYFADGGISGSVEGGVIDLSNKEKIEMYKWLDNANWNNYDEDIYELFGEKFGKNSEQTEDIIDSGWAVSRGLNKRKYADGGRVGKMYYHILEYGNYGNIGYHGYYENLQDAEKEVKRLKDFFPNLDFQIFTDKSRKEPPITTMAKGGQVDTKLSIKEVEIIANETAKVLGSDFSVTKNSVDIGTFDLDYKNIEYDGGTYIIMENGDVVNVALNENPVYYNYKTKNKFANGGEIIFFDRHASMDSETRDELQKMTSYPFLKEYFEGEDGEKKYDSIKSALEREGVSVSAINNYLSGLYDGYNYSNTEGFKKEMAKLKIADKEFYDRIIKVYEKISKYPKIVKEYADGGRVEYNVRGFKVGDYFYETPSQIGKNRFYKITSIDKFYIKADDYTYEVNKDTHLMPNKVRQGYGGVSSWTRGDFEYKVDTNQISQYNQGDLSGYSDGGMAGLGDVSAMLPNPLPMSTITPMANGGSVGYNNFRDLLELRDKGFKTIILNGFRENIGYVINLKLDDKELIKIEDGVYETTYKKGGLTKNKLADGGLVENQINELYNRSNFIGNHQNWKIKLLEMLQDESIEAYNIYQSLTEEQKEELLQELFEMDNDMGSDGDGEMETSKENLNILLDGAKNGKKYRSGGVTDEVAYLEGRINNLEELVVTMNEEDKPEIYATINKLKKDKENLIKKINNPELEEFKPKKSFFGLFEKGGEMKLPKDNSKVHFIDDQNREYDGRFIKDENMFYIGFEDRGDFRYSFEIIDWKYINDGDNDSDAHAKHEASETAEEEIAEHSNDSDAHAKHESSETAEEEKAEHEYDVYDNKRMLKNQAKEVEHHSEELNNQVEITKRVPAWVIAKMERATTDLSDITHYLDGENKMADGGELSNGTYDVFPYKNKFAVVKIVYREEPTKDDKHNRVRTKEYVYGFNSKVLEFDDINSAKNFIKEIKEKTPYGVPKANAGMLLLASELLKNKQPQQPQVVYYIPQPQQSQNTEIIQNIPEMESGGELGYDNDLVNDFCMTNLIELANEIQAVKYVVTDRFKETDFESKKYKGRLIIVFKEPASINVVNSITKFIVRAEDCHHIFEQSVNASGTESNGISINLLSDKFTDREFNKGGKVYENTPQKINLSKTKKITTNLGDYNLGLITNDFVYFVNATEEDENAQTIMYNKKGELLSDNIHATNDFFQVLQNEDKFEFIHPDIEAYRQNILKEN